MVYIKFQGSLVYVRHWPNGKKLLIFIHGFRSHSGYFETLATKLNHNSIGLLAFDLIGFGKSDGLRGHVATFDIYMSLLDHLIEKFGKKKQIYFGGESMGALLALQFLTRTRRDIKKTILIAPALKIKNIRRIEILTAKTLNRIFPTFRLKARIKKTTKDVNKIHMVNKDPFIVKVISARFGNEFLNSISKVTKKVKKIKVPILMLLASNDSMVDNHAAKKYYDQLTCKKEIKMYDGYHDLLGDLPKIKNKVLSDITKWIKTD